MRKSVIEDIFNGLTGSRETIKMPTSDCEQSLIGIYNKLKEILNPEQLSLLQNYEQSLAARLSEETSHYFAEGFKLGVQVGIETIE